MPEAASYRVTDLELTVGILERLAHAAWGECRGAADADAMNAFTLLREATWNLSVPVEDYTSFGECWRGRRPPPNWGEVLEDEPERWGRCAARSRSQRHYILRLWGRRLLFIEDRDLHDASAWRKRFLAAAMRALEFGEEQPGFRQEEHREVLAARGERTVPFTRGLSTAQLVELGRRDITSPDKIAMLKRVPSADRLAELRRGTK